MSVLRQKREQVNTVFQQLFDEAKELAEQLNVEIKCPRLVSRQVHRANNQPAQLAEEYFRRSVYIPLLDSIINDLQERLSPEVLDLFQLGVLIAKANHTCSNEEMETIKHLAVTYKPLRDNTPVSVIISEYRLWTEKWKRDQAIPQTISDLIMHCDGDMYPNIKKLLCILATLPVR
ncbi:unnamed protein product [Psylliodes chrysocephalus]|uniref:Uncharacterized protein n=1 Tax=Psylliodes chrysocephalus TaxID=3402493 RepID=A0A9P0D843_9CUCU|nr:unnamed protein product [Psylliodes chrysocephala]